MRHFVGIFKHCVLKVHRENGIEKMTLKMNMKCVMAALKPLSGIRVLPKYFSMHSILWKSTFAAGK